MIRLFLALSFLIIWCEGCLAESLRDVTPSLTIMGEAVEEVAPDTAILRFGIVNEGSTAEAAALENSRISGGVIKELEMIGVKEFDIYLVHLITQKSSREMIRKLSVIESRKFSQSIGIFSLRNMISASANSLPIS